MPRKRSGGKHTPLAIPSDKPKANSPQGRSWENKAAAIGTESGCLTRENLARDIFRERSTHGALALSVSAFSSYQIQPWDKKQEQCSQPLRSWKFKRIYGQRERLDHVIQIHVHYRSFHFTRSLPGGAQELAVKIPRVEKSTHSSTSSSQSLR